MQAHAPLLDCIPFRRGCRAIRQGTGELDKT
jgi:hypothetical protein